MAGGLCGGSLYLRGLYSGESTSWEPAAAALPDVMWCRGLEESQEPAGISAGFTAVAS